LAFVRASLILANSNLPLKTALCLGINIMNTPWAGEKVNLVIRCLAIVFVILAIIAFGIIVISLFERDYDKFPNLDFTSIIGVISLPYCFLLFLKVALTGNAPKSWIPWK
jgi:hypothetical protein